LTQSKRRWGNGWPRQRRRAEAPASNRNDLHGGRLAKGRQIGNTTYNGGTVKVDWPIIVNLRLDPFERTGLGGSLAFYNWFAYEFWRFVFVKQEIGQYAQTFLEFPPMQEGATFNLEALKAELEKKMEALKSKHGD